VLCLVQAAVVVGLESDVFVIYTNAIPDPLSLQSKDKGIPIYLVLFILSQIFLLLLFWDSLRLRNTIQLLAGLTLNLAVFGYSIGQYVQVSNSIRQYVVADVVDQVNPFLIAIPCITGPLQIAYVYLGYKLFGDFGWQIYKQIGPDMKMREMYLAYHIFLMLLKVDVFFFLGFGVQFIVLVLHQVDPEFWITIFAFPVLVCVLALAPLAVRKENKILMGLFMAGLLLGIAYYIFKLVRMYQPDQQQKYFFVVKYLTSFAALSLLSCICTLVSSIFCLLNFGKGLKDHFQREKENILKVNPVHDRPAVVLD